MPILDAWRCDGVNLIRRGRVSIPLASRASLVYGTYEPTTATTGVLPGTTLTDWNSPSTDKVTIPDGTVIENKIIYGDVIPGGSVIIRNCLAVGGTSAPTTDTGVFNCTGTARSGRLELYDVTIAPRNPRNGRNGVQGRQYTAERCYVKNTTDGFGVFSTIGAGTNADVTIKGCLVEDLLYTYPDPATSNHSDGAHTDCIQIQGGRNIQVIGNRLKATGIAEAGTGTNPNKPYLLDGGRNWANGACIIVQDNTGAGIDSTVVIDKNWTSGGISHYNVKTTGAGCQISNGKVYRDAAFRPATGYSSFDALNPYFVRFDAGMNQTDVIGITTQTWIDGPYAGNLLTWASRDLGMVIG